MRGLIRGSFAILLFSSVCASQSLRLDWSQNYATFQLSGKTLSGHLHLDDEAVTEDFDFTANITALNLDNVLSDTTAPAYFVFNCKEGQSGCVHTTTHTCQHKDSFPYPPCQPFDGDATNAFIGCPDTASYQRCVTFLAAVRAAAGSARRATPAPRSERASGRELSQVDDGILQSDKAARRTPTRPKRS